MRTTLALDDELLAKAQAFSGGTAFGMGFLFRMKAARHSSASNSMSAGRSGRPTQAAHMEENVGAASIAFSADELKQLNAELAAIPVRGERLPPAVMAMSGVEAPPKR